MGYTHRTKAALIVSVAMSLLLGVFGDYDYLFDIDHPSEIYQEVVNTLPFLGSGDEEDFEGSECLLLRYLADDRTVTVRKSSVEGMLELIVAYASEPQANVNLKPSEALILSNILKVMAEGLEDE